jgi:hypothetical protein
MKIILSAILLIVAAIGLWQHRELSTLKLRENALRAAGQGVPAHPGSGGTPTIRPHRSGGRNSFEPAAFVRRFEELVSANQPPSDEERVRLGEFLSTASPRELKLLVEELRRSDILPHELKCGIFIAIAPRLAESHPKLAAGIAVEGGEGNAFRAVMRTWLVSNPKAAAEWLETADPPLDITRFRSAEDLDLDALFLAAGVVSDPSGDGLAKLLRDDRKRQHAGLGEVMVISTPADFAKTMCRISQDTSAPESERLDLIGSTLARHQDPALARQILLDAALPHEQFISAAMILIRNIDPSNIPTSVDWFIAVTTDDPSRRNALARIREQWNAISPTEAAAYFESRNPTVPKD